MNADEFPTQDAPLEANPDEMTAAETGADAMPEAVADSVESNDTQDQLAPTDTRATQAGATDETGAPSGSDLSVAREQLAALMQQIADLQQQKQTLESDIKSLRASHQRMLQEQATEAQMTLGRLVKEGLVELEQRKQNLQIAVEQLERRQERIRAEMRTSFAGVSQDLAIRVQGFKDYLVGSLQDLVVAAEELQLVPEVEVAATPAPTQENTEPKLGAMPQFAEQSFQDQVRQIRSLLDQYRTRPDYYGPPWQLRRTFEPIHAERISNWFFTQGGRGAVRSMGSRLQNILIASAGISVLRSLYGNRLRTLVLANSPERLGEWRRGLQDCLGITRGDFGSDRGIVLFEAPEPLAQRADRLIQEGQLPLIIIDDSENQISLGMLQFPLWLAFAADPMMPMVL